MRVGTYVVGAIEMARKRKINSNWFIIYKKPYVDPETGKETTIESSEPLGPLTEEEAEDRLRLWRAAEGGSMATTQSRHHAAVSRLGPSRTASSSPRRENGRIAVAEYIRYERSRGLKPATIGQELDCLKTLLAAWKGIPVKDWTKKRYRSYLSEIKPGRGGRNPKRWAHRTKGIHLGVAKRWLEFLEDEDEFDIPDFVGALRPGKIKVVQMHEQPEETPYPIDELARIVTTAWTIVDERHASIQRRSTPHKEKLLESAISKALAVSQASLAGLALGDVYEAEWTEYDLDGPDHGTLDRYRRRTGTAIDIPIQKWLKEILLRHRRSEGLVCPHLPKSESSLHKALQTILRRAGVEPGGLHRLRHSFATVVRSASCGSGHQDGDYAAYGRLMGHKHGSPMSLPKEKRKRSELVIGLRYDHPDFDRCLDLVKRVERTMAEARLQGPGRAAI